MLEGKDKKPQVDKLIEVCNRVRSDVDQYLISSKYFLVHKVNEFKREFELISARAKTEISATDKKIEFVNTTKAKDELLREAERYLKPKQPELQLRKTWSDKAPLVMNDISFMYDKAEASEGSRLCHTTGSADRPSAKKGYLFNPDVALGLKNTAIKHKRSSSQADKPRYKEEFLNKTFSGRPELKVNISYQPETRFINQSFTFKSPNPEVSIKEDIVSIKNRLNDMMFNRMNASLKTDLLMTRLAGQQLSTYCHSAPKNQRQQFTAHFR